MSTTPKPFNPADFGVTPADQPQGPGAFDPAKFGVTPVDQAQPQANQPGFLQRAKQYVSDFVNKPLFPSMAEKAQEAGQSEQDQLNQIYGPESEKEFKGVPTAIQPLVKGVRHLATLPTSAARVAYGALGMSPMDATVVAASTAAGQPEAAGAYFATKGIMEAPQTIKAAVQNPSPENVEGALGTGATIAGGLGGIHGKGGAASIEDAASTQARNQVQLNKGGKLRNVARTVTGIAPAIEDAVVKGADKQGKFNVAAEQKNRMAIEKHQDAIRNTEGQNQEALAEHTLATEEAKQAATDKNAVAQQQYDQDLQRSQQENQAAEQTLALRKQSEANLQAKTDAYYNKETAAEAAADKANTENWNAWREKTKDVQLDMNPALVTINRVSARFPEAKQIIEESMRTPEDMTASQAQYVADRNSVMKQQGYGGEYDSLPAEAKGKVDDLMQRLGISPPEGVAIDPSKPVSLQTVHELKSNIGWKLFRNEYPPSVTGAMKQVYGTLQSMESRGSLEAGALPELESARASHQSYQEAFGRSKPNRAFEGDSRMKGANPEAYNAQQEEQRLSAVAKHDPTIPQAYRDVVSAREQVKGLPDEEKLRKGLKQPPEPPVAVEPKLPQAPELAPRPATPEMKAPTQVPPVDVQQVTQRALRERAKNWGHYNARDIGILSSSVVLAPVMYLLGEAIGHGGGASALAPIAAAAYEGGKITSAKLLRSETFQKWLSKTPPEEIQALAKIPGADKIKIQDGLTQIVIDDFKKGKRVDLSPEVKNFLGNKNMAMITAAAGNRSPKDLKDQANAIVGQ